MHSEIKSTKQGIADYLDLFDRSPYVLRGKEYQRVDGVSTLKSSWSMIHAPVEEAKPAG